MPVAWTTPSGPASARRSSGCAAPPWRRGRRSRGCNDDEDIRGMSRQADQQRARRDRLENRAHKAQDRR